MAVAPPDWTSVVIKELSSIVDDIYYIHDTFYPIDAQEKTRRLQDGLARAASCAKRLDSSNAPTADRAAMSLLLGRALDALPAYSPEAEDLLSKAVKLDPTNVDALNALGHCFWKKGDHASAMSCYNDSNKRKSTAVALRALSQLVRQASRTPDALADSVARAKAALALDMKDAASWSVLGAAYLIHYLAGSRDGEDLLRARKAYDKAAALEGAAAAADVAASSATGSSSDKVPVRDPDLHYNRAVVLGYLEEFAESLASYATASSIDPTLKNDGLEKTCRFVHRMVDMIGKKGLVKTKRVKELAAAVDGSPAAGSSEAIAIGDKRKAATLSTLVPGKNAGVYLRLRCVMPVARDEIPPPSAVVIDGNGDAAALSVYHLTEAQLGRFTDKQTITILDPIMKRVSMPAAAMPPPTHGHEGSHSSTEPWAYTCVQVLTSSDLLLDGRVLGKEASRQANNVRMENFDR